MFISKKNLDSSRPLQPKLFSPKDARCKGGGGKCSTHLPKNRFTFQFRFTDMLKNEKISCIEHLKITDFWKKKGNNNLPKNIYETHILRHMMNNCCDPLSNFFAIWSTSMRFGGVLDMVGGVFFSACQVHVYFQKNILIPQDLCKRFLWTTKFSKMELNAKEFRLQTLVVGIWNIINLPFGKFFHHELSWRVWEARIQTKMQLHNSCAIAVG